MTYHEWVSVFPKLTGKLNKKSALSCNEIDELLNLIEKTRDFLNKSEYEVMKRQ